MIPLYSEIDFKTAKSTTDLPFKCTICDNIFFIKKRFVTYYLKGKARNKFDTCSIKCRNISFKNSIDLNCVNCNKSFIKTISEIKKSKSGNHFCSSSCATTYNNKHKTKGNRRSKLEIYLEVELIKLYPDLEFHFNRKDAINSELDIYIPLLKLAFELNGIFHYESIYGKDKLNQIQNNDNRKFQACIEKGIELCIIDTSQQTYVKEKTSKKYLDIIINIINNCDPGGIRTHNVPSNPSD